MKAVIYQVQPRRGAAYYQVACTLKAAATPVLQFRIGDRVYSMTPNEYIERVRSESYLDERPSSSKHLLVVCHSNPCTDLPL